MTRHAIDLTGRQFGNWTVLHRAPNTQYRNRQAHWLSKCTCGNTLSIAGRELRTGKTTGCHTCSGQRRQTSLRGIPPGTTFERLTIIERAPNIGVCAAYICQCTCGTIKAYRATNLTHHLTKSCGCLRKYPHGHGGLGTRIYRIWLKMRERCNSPKADNFHNYGGRGISICQEWQNDFTAFREWSLANGYADHLSIDRINNDGNYEPANCRWATKAEQNRNKRNTAALHKLTLLRMICC